MVLIHSFSLLHGVLGLGHRLLLLAIDICIERCPVGIRFLLLEVTFSPCHCYKQSSRQPMCRLSSYMYGSASVDRPPENGVAGPQRCTSHTFLDVAPFLL